MENYFNEELYTYLLNAYKSRFGDDKLFEKFFSYTKQTIRDVVYKLSDPETKHFEVSDYVCLAGFKKIRKYFEIQASDVEVYEHTINSVCKRALTNIVFEAQLQYIRDYVKENGPIDPETSCSDYYLPSLIINQFKWHKHQQDLKVSHLINYDLNKIAGEQTRNYIAKFVDACTKVNEDKSVKEEPKSTITFSETRNVFEALFSRYEELINRKKQLEEELAGYEELKQQRDELDGEIIIFQERVKKLERKMSEDE